MISYHEWRELVDHDEIYLVRAIEAYLLTPAQDMMLKRNDLSISDLLNGRYPCTDHSIMIEKFYKPWNSALGWPEFVEY